MSDVPPTHFTLAERRFRARQSLNLNMTCISEHPTILVPQTAVEVNTPKSNHPAALPRPGTSRSSSSSSTMTTDSTSTSRSSSMESMTSTAVGSPPMTPLKLIIPEHHELKSEYLPVVETSLSETSTRSPAVGGSSKTFYLMDLDEQSSSTQPTPPIVDDEPVGTPSNLRRVAAALDLKQLVQIDQCKATTSPKVKLYHRKCDWKREFPMF